MNRQHTPLLIVALLGLVSPAGAGDVPPEAASPSPGALYEAEIRFQIEAYRNERITQFNEMMSSLEKLGFKKNPGPEDEVVNPKNDRASGLVPASPAREILLERHIKSLRLQPAGSKLPTAADAPVRVQLELAATALPQPGRFLYSLATVRGREQEGGPVLVRQQRLADQVRAVLATLGFREAVGYDTRAQSRLVGFLPANRLPALLDDLRRQPAAWRLPNQPAMGSLLVTELLRQSEGEVVLQGILRDWNSVPEGAKFLDPIANAWLKQTAAAEFIGTLPVDIRDRPDSLRPFILDNLVTHARDARANSLLQDVFKNVLDNPAAPALLDLVLKRPLPYAVTQDFPLLLRTESPIRITEVLPDWPLPRDRPPPSEPLKGQEKLTPELRQLLTAGGDKPQRLEVIMTLAPREGDRDWVRDLVAAAPSLIVEGRLGPLVSVLMLPGQAPPLAGLPQVSTIRLPRSGEPRLLPIPPGIPEEVRPRGNEPIQFPTLGHGEKSVRVAIIDGDFRGWQTLANRQLPTLTPPLDLTAERNPDLRPDTYPADGGELGHGTRCALAVVRAAPRAELVLIRIDAAAPYQLLTVVRALNGEIPRSINMERRAAEQAMTRQELEDRRAKLATEERVAFEEFLDEKDAASRQDAYRKNLAQWKQDEREFQGRVERFVALERALFGLKNVRVVACGLVWREGHPVDGGGSLSRYFDDRPFRSAFWFQAAGDTRGQSWVGPFRDRDGDGIMEFLPPAARLPDGLWGSSEAFLAWQSPGEKAVADLPAGSRLRVSIQWREPHDPDFLRHGEDVYRPPLANLRLLVLRQLDPRGQRQPADDFEVAAQSSGWPQRLDNQPASAVYEQTVEFLVKEAGRFALHIEGQPWPGIRPRGTPSLPAVEPTWELRPRLFVETLEGAGRAILRDLATSEGSIGTPGDARRTITVGTVSPEGTRDSASAVGPIFNLELLNKPTVLGLGKADTGWAAGFAAGLAARALSTGSTGPTFLKGLPNSPEPRFRLPAD